MSQSLLSGLRPAVSRAQKQFAEREALLSADAKAQARRRSSSCIERVHVVRDPLEGGSVLFAVLTESEWQTAQPRFSQNATVIASALAGEFSETAQALSWLD